MLLRQVLTSARVPESQVGCPNLTSLAEPGFEIFGTMGLSAASRGLESITVPHAPLSFMECVHRETLEILLFSLIAGKQGGSQRKFSTAFSDP